MTELKTSESDFLEQLGQTMRTRRALRGMSRKVLARVSGVSERYIAQLESGQGNISVILLQRLDSAVGANIADLFVAQGEAHADFAVVRDLVRRATPEQLAGVKSLLAGRMPGPQARPATPIPATRIALIGLRGAGKSTLGRLLADRLGWPFVELNKEIEATNGLSIAEILALYGQDGFRRLEQATLRDLIARPGPMVLATGGGIVSEPLTFDLVLSSFYAVWIKARPEEHMSRVRKQGDLRPMADDRSAMAELRTILLSREPLYAQAQAVVDTSGISVQAASDRLMGAVNGYLAPATGA